MTSIIPTYARFDMKERNFFIWLLQVVYASVGEFFSMLRCAMLYLFKSNKLDKPRPDQANKPDVLCVHGYFHNETPWSFFRKHLQANGVGPVNTVFYSSLRQDIFTSSVRIKNRIEKIKEQTGRDVRILIGHSLGGLACLEYALNYAPKDRLLYIITLGSPLQGTRTAIGYGPCVKQMRMNSPFLQSLHERLKEAKHIRVLTIASNTDLLIVPQSCALLPDLPYADCEVIEALGHVAFLFSPRIIRRIIAYLRKEGVIDRIESRS